ARHQDVLPTAVVVHVVVVLVVRAQRAARILFPEAVAALGVGEDVVVNLVVVAGAATLAPEDEGTAAVVGVVAGVEDRVAGDRSVRQQRAVQVQAVTLPGVIDQVVLDHAVAAGRDVDAVLLVAAEPGRARRPDVPDLVAAYRVVAVGNQYRATRCTGRGAHSDIVNVVI